MGTRPSRIQVFITRRVLSSSVFVSNGLLACRLISNGAKLLWARLARYAGTMDECFPLRPRVAADPGLRYRRGNWWGRGLGPSLRVIVWEYQHWRAGRWRQSVSSMPVAVPASWRDRQQAAPGTRWLPPVCPVRL